MNKDNTKNIPRVVIAGGSGFLGRRLAAILTARDYKVVILTRNASVSTDPNIDEEPWDAKSLGPWCRSLDGAAAIVNLTGKSVNCRPTPENRRQILNSRIDSVEVLGRAVRDCATPPPVWVQASSMAIYGNTGDREITETAPAAEGYPADVCVQWEEVLGHAALPTMRWVTMRIGLVLGREGGALPVLERLTKWGLGGSVGSGKQWVSWIHCADMDQLFVRAIEDPDMAGAYNTGSPMPLTNRDFMKTLRQVLRRPWSPPAPVFAVRMGSYVMGVDPNLALTGRRCLPERLLREGFIFQFPELEDALNNLYKPTATVEPLTTPDHEHHRI